MKLYDKIVDSSLLASFGIYYSNKIFDFSSKIGLEGKLYDWTIGGLPEIFIGAVGYRMIEKSIDKINSNNYLTKKIKINEKSKRKIASAGVLLGAICSESIKYSDFVRDPEDIIKYGIGGLCSAIYSYYNDKKDDTINLDKSE